MRFYGNSSIFFQKKKSTEHQNYKTTKIKKLKNEITTKLQN